MTLVVMVILVLFRSTCFFISIHVDEFTQSDVLWLKADLLLVVLRTNDTKPVLSKYTSNATSF